MGKIFYQTLRPLVNLYTHIVYNPKIYNSEVIPKEGGVIFAGNHLSKMDHLIVMKATKRSVRFLTKKELYKGPLNFFLQGFDTIPVDRENKEKNSAMQLSEAALNQGEAINIFPEGRRNKTAELLLPFKYGAVSLAKKTDCYIVPFGIEGELKPFQRGVKVYFGAPFKVEDDLEKANEALKQVIIALIEKGRKEDENGKGK